MSNTYGVNGSTAISYTGTFDAGVSTVSPDSLLEYCQMQLGDLDGQINDQMTTQQTALREREAVESAQNVLGQYGTAGPTNPTDMQKCVDAVNNAIAQLPAGDPVAGQLSGFLTQMCTTYNYKEATPLTADQTAELNQALQNFAGAATVSQLELIQSGTFTKPDSDSKQWQGTTEALATIADDVKSSAEIQMLQLQDLVSQRQQAVQLSSGIMSKTDQTLEDQAKAIGQG
ncbi:MAG: hypothetical protein WBY94_28635 [Polyangiaceae bacterium]